MAVGQIGVHVHLVVVPAHKSGLVQTPDRSHGGDYCSFPVKECDPTTPDHVSSCCWVTEYPETRPCVGTSCEPPTPPTSSCVVIVGFRDLIGHNCKALKINSTGLIFDIGKYDCPQ